MIKDIRIKKAGSVIRVISILIFIMLISPVLISCSCSEKNVQQPDAATNISGSAADDSGTQPSATPVITGPPLTSTGETDWDAVMKQSAAVVYLTINPEIALYVDSNNIVIYGDFINDDAKEAYSEINCSGMTIDDCTKNLIEAAIEHEYLTEDKEVKVDIAVIDENFSSETIREKTQTSITETTEQHDITVNIVTEERKDHGKVLCFECYGTGKCIYCDSCPPCEACSGKGYHLCDLCDEGIMTCSHCGGNTESEEYITETVMMDVEYCKVCGHKVSETDVLCPLCNGTGKQPCHMCGGVGRTFCTECSGKGYHITDRDKEKATCGRCSGTGLKHCNECDGTGYEKYECPAFCNHPGDSHEFRNEAVEIEVNNPNFCTYCQGRGKFTCEGCHGDYSQVCLACEGTGITPCGMCTQEGAHQKGVCSICLGTGYIER